MPECIESYTARFTINFGASDLLPGYAIYSRDGLTLLQERTTIGVEQIGSTGIYYADIEAPGVLVYQVIWDDGSDPPFYVGQSLFPVSIGDVTLRIANFAVSGLIDVGYQLYDSEGTAVGSRTTEGVFEQGSTGIYYIIDLDLPEEGWEGVIVWDDGDSTFINEPISPVIDDSDIPDPYFGLIINRPLIHPTGVDLSVSFGPYLSKMKPNGQHVVPGVVVDLYRADQPVPCPGDSQFTSVSNSAGIANMTITQADKRYAWILRSVYPTGLFDASRPDYEHVTYSHPFQRGRVKDN